ncbi:MAG TPA: Tex family protein [Puia sp.]|nr:Tex family protein [Puia sp.]
MIEIASKISEKLKIRPQQVETVLALLEEGSTIPFIARYRKDRTGALDEVVIQKIQDEYKLLKSFIERKTAIEKSITDQGKMTDILQQKLNSALTVVELEDIYLPYKPKRKTKAQAAREKGLEPLALLILEQKPLDLIKSAEFFFNDDINTVDGALLGARDIIAELINEDEFVRSKMRKLFEETARMESKVLTGKETEAVKFKDYFDFSERISTIPSHRILAVLRGFMEGYLRMDISPLEEDALTLIEEQFIKSSGNSAAEIKKAVRDSWRRLLQPGMESEFRMSLKTKADEEAITVFAENLRQLLLSSPLGSKRILAIDPGYRTGCKIVCLDEQGDFQKSDLIFIHEAARVEEAENKIRVLVNQFRIEAIAIGDGTAGRETDQFIKKLNLGLPVFLVNEDGASVYSASEIAREEFPDKDITVRGSISIGRRLMDPLAELVKIDPKSIGVGQYQHDVNQVRLKERLDQTVISCVNAVGVNLNTAGKQLLSYVSGIGETLAGNIIKHRNEIGKFTDRKQLLKVPRLGEKAFEQCAGFLRIRQGKNPLDESAVHPEAYDVVERIALDVGVEVKSLIGKEELIKRIDAKKYASETIGELTVRDILNELRKPGLDPRAELEPFEFANIYKLEDVKVGMIVPGVVTNITRFGAFIDIGVKQDGLVHVSEIADKFITDPNEVLKLNDKVQVKVTEVDVPRKRIALSIKQALIKSNAKRITRNVKSLTPNAERSSAAGSRVSRVKVDKPKTNARINNPREKSMEEALEELKKKFKT